MELREINPKGYSKRYKIVGVLPPLIIKHGIIRQKQMIGQYLNTEIGVLRYLHEFRDIEGLHVTDLVENKDKTDYFLDLYGKTDKRELR